MCNLNSRAFSPPKAKNKCIGIEYGFAIHESVWVECHGIDIVFGIMSDLPSCCISVSIEKKVLKINAPYVID